MTIWIEIWNYVLQYTGWPITRFIARHRGAYTTWLANINKLKSQCRARWHGLLLCPIDWTNWSAIRCQLRFSDTNYPVWLPLPRPSPSISSSPFNSCRPSLQAVCAVSAVFTLPCSPLGLERYQTRHPIPNNIGLSQCQYPIPIQYQYLCVMKRCIECKSKTVQINLLCILESRAVTNLT